MILAFYPGPEEHLAAVQEKDGGGRSVLHLSVENPEALQVILSPLPKSDRLTAVQERDKDGNTVLHHALFNPESLQLILSSLGESDRLAALKEKNRYGRTVLQVAAKNPQSLETILSSLSLSDVMVLGRENPSIDFTVLKKVIIAKAAVKYTPEQLILLGDASDIGGLQVQLNSIAQAKIKGSLPREPDEFSEESKYRPKG